MIFVQDKSRNVTAALLSPNDVVLDYWIKIRWPSFVLVFSANDINVLPLKKQISGSISPNTNDQNWIRNVVNPLLAFELNENVAS